jgi:hypothetical protein
MKNNRKIIKISVCLCFGIVALLFFVPQATSTFWKAAPSVPPVGDGFVLKHYLIKADVFRDGRIVVDEPVSPPVFSLELEEINRQLKEITDNTGGPDAKRDNQDGVSVVSGGTVTADFNTMMRLMQQRNRAQEKDPAYQKWEREEHEKYTAKMSAMEYICRWYEPARSSGHLPSYLESFRNIPAPPIVNGCSGATSHCAWAHAILGMKGQAGISCVTEIGT